MNTGYNYFANISFYAKILFLKRNTNVTAIKPNTETITQNGKGTDSAGSTALPAKTNIEPTEAFNVLIAVAFNGISRIPVKLLSIKILAKISPSPKSLKIELPMVEPIG
ncbi:MAG: hypothetical protein K9H26_12270 [Prolixibacteraceae bacterium]|nr:hypothetical protein [Prolixibacteraceae bacterium]